MRSKHQRSERGRRKLPRDLKIVLIILTVFAVFSVVFFIINFFTPVKYLSAFWVAADDKHEQGQMRVRFIDVGQGDCTLVEFPDGKTLLADGGDGSIANCKSIFYTLNKSGIDRIDYVVCSSVSSLRSGGLSEIFRYKEVGKVFAPYCLSESITEGYKSFSRAAAGRDIEYCEFGAGYTGEDYGFFFLTPNRHDNTNENSDYYLLNTDPTDKNIDNASATLYIYCGDTAILLLGDARTDRQLQFFQSFASGFEIDGVSISPEKVKLIKASGNGSLKSVCSEIYDYIKPQFTVISASEKVLPSAKALSDAERYSKLFKTYEDGTVTAIIKDGKIKVYN